jgi:hypothetical protein
VADQALDIRALKDVLAKTFTARAVKTTDGRGNDNRAWSVGARLRADGSPRELRFALLAYSKRDTLALPELFKQV